MAEAFSSQHTQSFADFLKQTGVSLLVSTYQAGKLISLRHQDGVLNTHFVDMPKPMGIALQEPHLAVGTGFQLAHYFNMSDVAAKVEPINTHNACYVPREVHITGDIDIHEMGFTSDGELWLVNTKMSCLCTIEQQYSVVPKWRPPFISGYDLTDRCHLNGLAMRDGEPAYVSALGTTDTAAGWRDNKAAGGMLMDIESNKMIASGLSMPHSPRWYQDTLYVLESGAGSLATVDIDTGELTTIVELPGFTRGLDFIGRYAVIGLSQVRETAVFAGLPLTKRCDERQCGVYIVDIVAKQVVGFVTFSGEVQEIFSVQIVPSSFPAVLSMDDPLLRSTYAIPDEALKDLSAPDPDLARLEQANLLYSQKKVDEAIAAYKALLVDHPNKTQIRMNLGMIYMESKQWQAAVDILQELVLDGDNDNNADAFNALGRAWTGLNNWQKAKDNYDCAIEIDQQFAAAHYNRAMVLLSEGQYAEAWKALEWRWKIPGNKPFDCAQPQWKSSDPLQNLKDKVVLVHTEQSNSDTILYARFLPLLAKYCKKLVVVCAEPLRLFFKGFDGVDEVRLPNQLTNDSFDTFIPIVSLADVMGVTKDNIPSETPYWKIPTEIAVPKTPAKSNSEKSSFKRIGLVWRVDPQHSGVSFELQHVLPWVKQLPDTQFFSIQSPLVEGELATLEAHQVISLETELVSYAHAGALIKQLDLLICVDSSFAHLAASMGVPTWLVVGDNPNWVWQNQSNGSTKNKWYPSVNIFRQSEGSDLKALSSEILQALQT